MRDYIHVVDLALGHLAALRRSPRSTGACLNLGTGTGYSVLEMVEAAREACGNEVPYEIVPRRPATSPRATPTPRWPPELGWRAERGLDAMVADAWRWQRANPEGFES